MADSDGPATFDSLELSLEDRGQGGSPSPMSPVAVSKGATAPKVTAALADAGVFVERGFKGKGRRLLVKRR